LQSTRRTTFLILIAFLYLYFRGIQDHGLLDPIEGVNASVALNMVARGHFRDFVFPRVGDLPWAGKTLGFWWLEALLLVVFGWSEFSVRFLSVAATLGTLVAVWFLGRRMQDERAANYTAIIAGTGFSTYVASQLASPHALYVSFLSAALVGLVYAFRDRRFFLLFHASAALAFIVCGPAGIVLPWLSLLLYAFIAEQERFLLSALLYRPGLVASLLLGGGYLLMLHVSNPAMLTLMRYNPPAPAFGSFSSAAALFVLGLLPWAGCFVEALAAILPHRWSSLLSGHVLPSRKEGALLSVWAAVFLFFGLFSGDGLLVIAVFPALAALSGTHFSQALEKRELVSFQRSVLFEVLFFFPLLLVGILWLSHNGSDALQGTLTSIAPWLFFCFLFLFAGWHYARTRQPKKMMLHLCLTSMLALLPQAGILDLLAQGTSVRDVGLFIRDNMERDDIIVQYALNRPALFFYTARSSLLLHTQPIPGVMGQEIPEDLSLVRTWEDSKRVFMVIEKRQQNLTSLPPEVYNLIETNSPPHRLVVLSNRREKTQSGETSLSPPDTRQ
jgi:4-amino-4-deoxy-L-arabinose transferase-like glycosyltransferase